MASIPIPNNPDVSDGAVDAELVQYYEKHSVAIEDGLGEAVDRALVAKADDPLTFIGTELLVGRGKTTLRQLNSVLEDRDAAAAIMSRQDLDMRHAVLQAKDRLVLQSENDENDPRRFTAAGWLGSSSLNLVDMINEALLQPLWQEGSRDPRLERPYIAALGRMSDASPIVAALERRLQAIGEKIYQQAKELSENTKTEKELSEVDPTSKFFDGDSGDNKSNVLQFGDQAYFERGLDKFIGPPNPNLRETMEYARTRPHPSPLLTAAGGDRVLWQVRRWSMSTCNPAIATRTLRCPTTARARGRAMNIGLSSTQAMRRCDRSA